MEELVRVTKNENGDSVVSARELHQFLIKDAKGGQIGEDFVHWIKRAINFGFEDGVDYVVIKYDYTGGVLNSESVNQRVSKTEYALTLDTAKHISMVQNNDKGREARKYFIACEKKLTQPKTRLELAKDNVLLIEEDERKSLIIAQKDEEIKAAAPKVAFANAVATSEGSILVRDFAKAISTKDFNIGQNKTYDWFRNKGYLMKDNSPYQQYIEQGLFEVITRVVGSGEVMFTTKTTKITGKGIEYFERKIKN